MKKWLWILLLLLPTMAKAQVTIGQYTLLNNQFTATHSASTSSLSLAYPNPVQKGDLLIVTASCSIVCNFTSAGTYISDTANNKWTQIGTTAVVGATLDGVVYWAVANTTTADTVTASIGATPRASSMALMEVKTLQNMTVDATTNWNNASSSSYSAFIPTVTSQTGNFEFLAFNADASVTLTDTSTAGYVVANGGAAYSNFTLLETPYPSTTTLTDSANLSGTANNVEVMVSLRAVPITQVLSGTLNYPNLQSVSGNLYVSLERSALRNNCVTPSITVPTTPTTIAVSNGSLQGSISLVPTDCLSSFQPYLITLKDGRNNLIFKDHWYIPYPGGGTTLPKTGTAWLAPAGFPQTAYFNDAVYTIQYPIGGYHIATSATTSVGADSYSTVSMNWKTIFPDTNYVMVCTVLDVSAPLVPLVSTGVGQYTAPITNVTRTGFSLQVFNSDASNTRTYKATCYGHERTPNAPVTLVLKDSNNIFWQLRTTDTGILQTGTIVAAAQSLTLNDPSNSTSWQLGVTTTGQLTTTSVSLVTTYPQFYQLISLDGTATYNLGVTSAGLLTTQ